MKNFLTKIFGKNVSRYYTSPIDQFLIERNKKFSPSQCTEFNKLNRIARLRDQAITSKQKDLFL